MPYNITKYSYDKAQKLGLTIKPSTRKDKKIDVFQYKNGAFINAIGGFGYKDYPTYIKENGKTYADERRRLYKIRHDKDRKVKGSKGWYADQLLW